MSGCLLIRGCSQRLGEQFNEFVLLIHHNNKYHRVVLSTGYIFEMAHTKPSMMGLLHHLMALGFACFANAYFTTGTPYDAHWLLMLSYPTVFAVGVGGIITSCLRVLYLFDPPRQTPQRKESAATATALTWALTASITISWTGCIWNINRYFDEFYLTLRHWTPLITLSGSFIFIIQWWWIFLWHNKKEAMVYGRTKDSREVFRRSYYNIASFICGCLFLGMLEMNWRCATSTIKDLSSRSIF